MTNHISNKSTSRLTIGDAGITNAMSDEGYFATICATISPIGSPLGEIQFQDLHVTEEQLIGLYAQIETFLKYKQKYPK
jgi:hypothetical protein